MVTVSERGFHGYAKFASTYGHEVSVYESSAASGPHVWVAIEGGQTGEPTAHLNEDQARALRDALSEFLNEIPERWGQTSSTR